MPRRLSYSNDALADLAHIREWLTQPGAGSAAQRKLTAIRASIRALRDHPCMYAAHEQPGVRELPCQGGYRALYRLDPDTGSNETAGDIRVLRVFGPGQNRRQP